MRYSEAVRLLVIWGSGAIVPRHRGGIGDYLCLVGNLLHPLPIPLAPGVGRDGEERLYPALIQEDRYPHSWKITPLTTARQAKELAPDLYEALKIVVMERRLALDSMLAETPPVVSK